MTRLQAASTTFTAGELDPEMFGRADLRVFQEGAAKLRNVVVKATGGVERRRGFTHKATVDDAERLIRFENDQGEFLIIIGTNRVEIWNDDGLIQNDIVSLWRQDQLRQITWASINQSLIICHGEVEPQQVFVAATGSWVMQPWNFEEISSSIGNALAQPYTKIGSGQNAIQAINQNITNPNEADAIPAGADVLLRTTEPFFADDHNGAFLRIKGREVRILNVQTATRALGVTWQELIDGRTTRQFEEQVFSEARGWPKAIAQYQDRLVVGGASATPDLLWFSKSGDYFNFDVGSGLDDEAISFRISDSSLQKIRHLTGGRDLKVLTNRGEWTVSGNPLTPTNIQLGMQTSVGSPEDRQIRPLDVDGATVFIGASKRDVREFIFVDSEQAFQAPDIAFLASHLIEEPRELAFVPEQRLLVAVLDDGALATATIDRNANIIAWSRQETNGIIQAATMFKAKLHVLVERQGAKSLEIWDQQSSLDAAVHAQSSSPQNLWGGFSHLQGQVIELVADGQPLGEFLVASETLDIGQPASEIIAGLRYEHEIKPLPLTRIGNRTPLDTLYRPIRSVFRIHECRSLDVETMRGERTLLAAGDNPEPQSGDFAIRDYGWRRGQNQFHWRIRQSDPHPFTLLSTTTEIKVNN